MPKKIDYVDEATIQWQELRPADDLVPFSIVSRIRRLALVAEAMQEEAVREHEFSVLGDYQLVALLRRANCPLQPSQIAQQLRITRAGVTGRLNRLEKQGMVVRTESASDARLVEVQITTEGIDLVDRAFSALLNSDQRLVEGLKPGERKNLAQNLKAVLLSHDVGQNPEPTHRS